MAHIPDSRKDTLGPQNPKQQAYLKVLVAHPRMMNREIWQEVRDLPIFAGCKADPQRMAVARDQLGITISRGNGKRITDIDLEQFMEVAETLGVKYELPSSRYEDSEGASFSPVPALPASVVAAATAAEPSAVKPTHPAPEPVTLAELKVLELLSALRGAMKAENYTEIHVTPDGISYKRVVVEEGTIAF
jgi:hypothetical protein